MCIRDREAMRECSPCWTRGRSPTWRFCRNTVGAASGGALIAEILQFARQAALAEITLEVRVSNEGAIALYRRAGFFVCGERKNFYRMPVENAYLMKYTFPTDRENLQGV